MKARFRSAVILFLTIIVLLLASSRLPADTGTCSSAMTTLPFTDVMGSIFFCQIAEAYFSGLTNGTTSTTYSPSDNVPREQMAAFVTRTQDSALRRGSRRAALNKWWTPTLPMMGLTNVALGASFVASDGADLWVPVFLGVTRVRASDGSVLQHWTGATNAVGVLIAHLRIYVTGETSPGNLYVINPSAPPGIVTTLSTNLGNSPLTITTDGSSLWTANNGGSVSRVDPNSGVPNTFTTGFSQPFGILFDGTNIWITDQGDSKLKKLDSNGAILQSVAVGSSPAYPVFDGSNIWVPNFVSNSVSVIRARDGQLLATLTGNGLNGPTQPAFDGQRILVTNSNGNSVSLWKASDLTPLGSFAAGTNTFPYGACSDGINFWIVLQNTGQLAEL
jgi:DNA-binding beta-propeller fold protein YncE